MKLIKYIEEVEKAIKDKNINGTCTIGEDKITCNNEDITIKSKLENAIEGSLTIENNKVKSYSNMRFATEKKAETNNEVPQVVDEENTNDNNSQTQEKYATLVSDSDGDGEISIGDKYTYKVNNSDTFNFYVLSIENDKVNLIMDRNICEDGTTNYTEENNYCRCTWHAGENNNSFGPDTAILTLYTGTKEWINVPKLNLEYLDERNIESLNKGYTSLIINEGVSTITGKPKDNIVTIGTNIKPLRSRLPKLNELNAVECHGVTVGVCPAWLMENMKYYNISDDKYFMNNNNEVYQNIMGYWLLSSGPNDSTLAHQVLYYGLVSYAVTTNNSNYGVRPVITVPMSYLIN